MMYGSWDMEHDRQNFYPPNNPENQNFEKMKKILGDIIILHMCTINENHMMYGSWDKECHRQNLFSFWTIFCSFTPLTTQKIKIFKKRQHLQISSFYTSVPWMTIIWSIVTEIWSMADIIFCHFSKVWKNEKNTKSYHNFTEVYQKPWS